MPREYWDHTEGQRPDQKPDWHPRYGDRVQMLVFIGQQMDEQAFELVWMPVYWNNRWLMRTAMPGRLFEPIS